MRFLGSPDTTQSELLPFLEVTEQLLFEACESAGGSDGVEIVALPDLGIPHNAARVHGGFLTGALYRWTCAVPFVPVDATVNLCGVAVFEIEESSPLVHSFHSAVKDMRGEWGRETPYRWNFTTGNHFISCARDEAGKWFLLLHASPAEFKANYPGLYPSPTAWFRDDVKTVRRDKGGRYLRFLRGHPAERFHRRAIWLRDFQIDRMRTAAEMLAGRSMVLEELFNETHYGMPTRDSIGIGCYVFRDGVQHDYVYPLLTRPKASIPLVRVESQATSTVEISGHMFAVTPHGLGVRSTSRVGLEVRSDRLTAWGREHETSQSLGGEPEMRIREYDGERTLSALLSHCPGTVVRNFSQIHSVYRGSELA